MILTEVIDRLRAVAMPPFLAIEGAEELEALNKGTAPRHGTLFVLPFEEQGEPNPYISGVYQQRVEVSFLTAAVIRSHESGRGMPRVEAADEFARATEAALCGWSPDAEAHAPLALIAGRSAPSGNGVMWLVQTWSTDRYIRKEL